MEKKPASAFYYTGLLFDFENFGQATRTPKGEKNKLQASKKIFQPCPLHPPFKKKKTFLSRSLAMYFAAQTELSVRVPTHQTYLCQID